MAARNWYDFDIDDYGVLKFDRFSRSELLHRDMARCIVRFMKTGEFPGICYPGQKDAKFEVEP
jgi:hypothetical protein